MSSPRIESVNTLDKENPTIQTNPVIEPQPINTPAPEDLPPPLDNPKELGLTIDKIDDIPLVPMEDFSVIKKIGQFTYRVGEATTVAIVLSQYLNLPDPYGAMLAVNAVYLNYNVGGILSSVFSKENPFSELVADGGGEIKKGVVKTFMPPLISAEIMAGVGYGLNKLIVSYSPDLLNSDKAAAQTFGMVLNTDAYKVPIIGLVGFGGAIGIQQFFRMLLNCCMPGKEDEINDNPDLNALQKFGDYVVLPLFGDMMLTETILYYLNVAGQNVLSSNPDFQMGLLLGSHAVRGLYQFCNFKLHPCDALVKESMQQMDKSEEENQLKFSVPAGPKITNTQYRNVMLRTTIINALTLGTAYCTNMLLYTCYPTSKENRVEERLFRYAVSLGGALTLNYAVKTAIPAAQKISKFCSGFFNHSTKPPVETNPLLSEKKGFSYTSGWRK